MSMYLTMNLSLHCVSCHNNNYYIVVGHINVVAALLGFLVRKSMDIVTVRLL